MDYTNYVLPKIKNFFFTYFSSVKLAWQASKSHTILILTASSIQGLIKLPYFYITAQIINTIINATASNNPTTFIKMLIFYLSVNFLLDYLDLFLNNILFTYQQNLSRRVNELISINILVKLNNLTVTNSENPNIRNTYQKVDDNSGSSTWGIIYGMTEFPSIIFNLVSSSIYIIGFQPLILIPAALISIPHILVGIQHSKANHELKTSTSSLWRVYGAFENLISKGRYIYENKILNHTNKMLKERSQLVYDIFDKSLALENTFNKKRQIVYIPREIFSLGVRIWVYYLALNKQLVLGNAQAIANSFGAFSGNFSWLIRNATSLFQHHLFIKDYNDFMALPEENRVKGVTLPTLTQGFEFKDVWFKYPNSDNYILKGVSFSINHDDNLAIVGVNGAGKSTIIKLICRFYEPDKGQILLNGKDISTYSLKSYRHAIAALFQDFAQYPFSALVNISYGDVKRKALLSKVRKAAKLADIDHFLASLPKRYQTPLDKEFKGGLEPSKGQWQRIALARALYRKSPIIILDEPTSNVDPETEEIIFDRLLKVAADKCVILVSHRFSTVKRADQILVLENGVVAQIGSHEQLMKSKGAYHRLYSLQAKSYKS